MGTILRIRLKCRRVRLARRVALMVLVATSLLLAVPMVARAAQRQGTLTLVCTVERDGAAVPLAGDTYELAKVASATVGWDGGAPAISYEPAEGFEAQARDWAHLDADGWRSAARDLDAWAAARDLYRAGRATSDATGTVRFGWLDPGIYLVRRSDVAAQNASYTCDPVLVSVPAIEDGALVYQVVAEPKFERDDEPGTPPTPGEPGEPERPGDTPPEGPDMPAMGDYVAALGLLLVACGALLVVWGRRLSKKDPEDK